MNLPVDTLTAVVATPQLHALPVFNDNYVWILRAGAGSEACLVVDPGDPAPVAAYLQANGLRLTAILVTHHHMDHIGGVVALKTAGVTVYGPRHESIPALDVPLGEGDRIQPPGFGGEFRIFDVPGHTAGHIAYLGQLDDRPLLFCGDTLFSAGCGRLFEGTAAELHDSLTRLATLPDDTLVCCTHEYTAGNLRFAAAVEPDNADIARCAAWVAQRRERKLPSLPGDLARERRINPFLRSALPGVRGTIVRHAALADSADADTVFAALRRWKDDFR